MGSLEFWLEGKPLVPVLSHSQGETEALRGKLVCPGSHCQAEGYPGLSLRHCSFRRYPGGALRLPASALRVNAWTRSHHQLWVWGSLGLWLLEKGLWGGQNLRIGWEGARSTHEWPEGGCL